MTSSSESPEIDAASKAAKERLDQIAVVLVAPQLAANVGAAARAMLTMGLTDLRIVSDSDWLNAAEDRSDAQTARTLAAGAERVLDRARVYPDLSAALADCAFAVGTSARSRRFEWPLLSPAESAQKLAVLSGQQRVAVVFGRERSGLTNAELDQCQAHLHIDANPAYSSLNLAAAVQVVCYELRMAVLALQAQADDPSSTEQAPLASGEQLEGLFEHLEAVLAASGFLDPGQPKQLMRRLRRLFNRSRLERTEIHILRGILRALDPREPRR